MKDFIFKLKAFVEYYYLLTLIRKKFILRDTFLVGSFLALCQMVLVKKTQNNKITMEGEIV